MSSNLRTSSYALLKTPPLPKSPAQQPELAIHSESNGDYFFVSTVQAAATSAASPSITQRNSPVGLLQTPSSTKSQSYFTQRHRSNSPRYQHSPSSDNLSTPSQTGLSPKHSSAGSQYSSGGSVYSSNSGNSYCSNSSGEYLTPPRTEGDGEKPPYRPRRKSSDSLTLLRKTKRAKSVPHNTAKASERMRRRRRRKQHCRHKEIFANEHQNRPYWWLPPTVSPRPNGLSRRSSRNCKTPVSNMSLPVTPMTKGMEIRERIFPKPTSHPAPPVTVRRWSAAATPRQMKFQSITQHGHNAFDLSILSLERARATLQKLSRYGSDEPRIPATVSPDIVQAIREKLTSRKLSVPYLPIPASITLRRASGISTTTEPHGTEPPLNTPGSVSDCSDQKISSDHSPQRPSETYLITSKDIDSITDLISTRYQMKVQPDIRIDVETPTPSSSSRTTRVPSITSKGVFPSTSSVVSSTLTTAQAQRSFSRRRPMKSPQKLSMGRHLNGDLTKAETQKNLHEVIWQGGISPSVSDVTDDEDRFDCNFSSLFSEPTTPLNHPNQAPDGVFKTKYQFIETAAFDPQNANTSIKKWSWQCRSTRMASSDSDIGRQSDGPQSSQSYAAAGRGFRSKKAPTDRVRRLPRSSRSESQLLDVVSFPPLPRRTTNDWHSPLPEIEMAPELHNSKCLYSIGLDITCGPSSCSSKTVTPKNSSPTFVRNTAIPKCPSVDFRPFYNHWSRNIVRSSTTPLTGLCATTGKDHAPNMRETLDIHTKASPQTGISSETGQCIGLLPDKRRTSSTQSLQRVRTIDHKDKGSRGGTWSQRRPPSVCPPPVSESPSDHGSGAVTPVLDRQDSEFRRRELLRDKTPALPKVDHVGIYRQLTGGSARNGALNVCAQDCEAHFCEDCANDPRKPSIDWIG
ncbi:hypothetical protein BGZ60DRAFT_432013 [Tricladium varicosporioides]|nr:hypothetical protein BGZ60DRAFT_432013 [Hymenoscyphus varicosporioides]